MDNTVLLYIFNQLYFISYDKLYSRQTVEPRHLQLDQLSRATLTLKMHVFRQQLTRRIFHDIPHERVAQLVCIIL